MINAQPKFRFTGFVIAVYSSFVIILLFGGNGSYLQRFQHNWQALLLLLILIPIFRLLTLSSTRRITSKYTESREISPFWLRITSPSASFRSFVTIFLGGAFVFVVSLLGYVIGAQSKWLMFIEGLGVLLGAPSMGFVADVWRIRNDRRSSQN